MAENTILIVNYKNPSIIVKKIPYYIKTLVLNKTN